MYIYTCTVGAYNTHITNHSISNNTMCEWNIYMALTICNWSEEKQNKTYTHNFLISSIINIRCYFFCCFCCCWCLCCLCFCCCRCSIILVVHRARCLNSNIFRVLSGVCVCVCVWIIRLYMFGSARIKLYYSIILYDTANEAAAAAAPVSLQYIRVHSTKPSV
jgi:hypothetical protein